MKNKSASLSYLSVIVCVMTIALAPSAYSDPANNTAPAEVGTHNPLGIPAENRVNAGGATPLPPPDEMATWWKGPYLTGDWGGLRQQLVDEGVTPYIFYNAIVAGNPTGGTRPGGGPQYAHDFNFGLTFDMQKLTGWEGAEINVNGIDRAGQDISRDIGGVYSQMQLVGGQNIFLYDLTLTQKFLNDVGRIKVGRMSAGDDFATSPLYGYYLNNGIDGNIRSVLFDTRFSAYPFPVWGAVLRFDPTPEFNSLTGLFQVSDRMFNRQLNGVDFGIRSYDGYSLVQQFGWTPEFDKQPVEAPVADSQDPKSMKGAPKMVGMPGHYFIGGYWSNSDYSQFGSTQKTRISYGFYAHADQMVYRAAPGSDRGLTVFAVAALDPQPNLAIVPFQLSGGAIYKGLISGRPDDRAVFGVIYGNFSNDYADSVETQLGGLPTEEIDLEWGYRVQASPFAYIQPDVELVTNPGGSANIPDAVVLGAQFGLKF